MAPSASWLLPISTNPKPRGRPVSRSVTSLTSLTARPPCELAASPERLADFKNKLVDQICEASGGPCKYTGRDMKTAHEGLGISGADFDALVADLVGALDKFKVGKTEKDQLLAILGPMKPDIVEKK